MTLTNKGLVLAALQCAMVLSLSGKLIYDRSTRPRVWVLTTQYDPNLPIRGRYLSLRLAPKPDAAFYGETVGRQVLFFVPEKLQGFEARSSGTEIWAEVTIPKKGPPRPIRLAVKSATGFEVIESR
jgi:hypothetical protein